MWPPTLTLDVLLLVSLSLGAYGERTSYRPQSCTLECIRQGDPRCEYCRITADDVQIFPSIPSSSPFGNKPPLKMDILDWDVVDDESINN